VVSGPFPFALLFILFSVTIFGDSVDRSLSVEIFRCAFRR
jgi:hypothetical protein